MTRLLPRIVTLVLLGTLLFLGQQMLISSPPAQAATGACHNHTSHPKAPAEPTNHECCAIGHNTALLAQNNSGLASMQAVSAAVTATPAAPSLGHQPLDRPVLHSTSAPGRTLLRI